MLLLSCCLLLLSTGGGRGLSMEGAEDQVALHVVENGTMEALVLDCPFSLDEGETGTVVKWFFRDFVVSSYQWIPFSDEPPKAFGPLLGRVDVDWKVSGPAEHTHRALRLLAPTTELSGNYRCFVSTFDDEMNYSHRLIVYSRPQVEVWAEQLEEQRVAVGCRADQVYPQPDITFTFSHASAHRQQVRSGVDKKTSFVDQGYYNMTAQLVMDERQLDGDTTFSCIVTLPDASVEVVRQLIYQPRIVPVESAVTQGAAQHWPHETLLAALLLLALTTPHTAGRWL